jgi:uncharacterized protein
MTAVALRPVRRTDWPAVYSWTAMEEASRYQDWGPSTAAQTRSFLEQAEQAWLVRPQERYPYAAEVAGVVVGIGEISVRSVRHRQGEISYVVHPDRWRQGIGTGIAGALLRFGFTELDLHRIFATCDPRNVSSARVLAKVGMACEGRMREVMRIRDGWRDSALFSILRRDWAGTAGVPGAVGAAGRGPTVETVSVQEMSMEGGSVTALTIEAVPVDKPDEVNVIIGQSHFIKTVDDLHEALVGVSAHLRFGIAFCEASGPCLIRHSGNDDDLVRTAIEAAQAIGAGHTFVVMLREGYPVNVLNQVKAVPEVCSIFCASANPVDVLVANSGRGRGVVGVIDGSPPAGVETADDIANRRTLLRNLGYKL